MTEKIIKYKADGRDYDVYESEVSKFLETYPNATIRASVDDRNYDVFPSEMDDFLKVYPNASYTVDNPSSAITDTNYEPTLPDADEDAPEVSRRERRQARREERREARRNDDRPSWGESAAKGVGAGFTRTGKGLLDALHQLSAGMLYNDPETGEAKRLESYDAQMQDETNTFRNASVLASETAEELSREADPTGGEKGFVDLIAEGKIGMALQKGLATGAESLPMTLSAYNPWTMALNAISMAGANYAEETLDNPEIDPWKRAVKAIGSAAIEQAVEKFADPVFKYIGGGKGAGELTEELAKELVEKGTKEATENIAKRIFRVLKNTAKDAAGEGIEEVVTSFGNDALGQALDWIDGDNDYGIRAQWDQMKSENPDADAWDFALAKGKEYMDSFIGGALSGGYMSGTANVFSEGAKFKYDRDARKILDESHAIGSSLDYGDIYDSDDTLREQMDAVAATFTNEKGEAGISNEFIGALSSEDAFALSRRNDFTPEQQNALFGLARAKAIQEGLTTKLDERLESQINDNKVLIEDATENGSIITAMYGGKPVYVMGAWNKGDGTVTAPSGQNGPVMVVDAMTGEKSYARSEDIQFAESKNPDEYAREIEVMLRENDARNRQVAQSTMSVRAKAKAVKPFAGKKILVDVGNGLTEVLVQQISPNGDVIIKGKKGDLGGQSIMTLSADVFYDSIYRDEDGNPVITEAPQETEAETPQEEAPVAETTGNEDYIGQTIPILLDGVPTEVEVMSQDNPSDSIVFEYTDASGNRMIASATIGAFNAAIQQAAEYFAPTPTAEETPSVETAPADSETQVPQEVPVTPENIDWDALFEQDPEAYFVELQNQFGEEALDILNEEVVAAQEELDSLSKKRGKTQNERLENRQKKVALQGRIDTLNGMIARLAPAEAPVVETPATETPAEVAPTEQPTAPPETAPAVTETTPVTETPAVPESTDPAPVEQTPVAEAPAETVAEPEPAPVTTESTPVAPNPVDNPAREAQKREKALAQQLQRYGISPEQKSDMAFNAGKAVGDFFATREEYDAYAENATDLGDYNADFERGVDASFANRQQNVGNSPVNSVPLETEPNEENNGEEGTSQGTIREGQTGVPGSEQTYDEGAEEGASSPQAVRGSGADNSGLIEDRYPARKGDITRQELADAFGLNSVSPAINQEVLNSVYDFMMEMSKMLGISPKSIGHGATLGVKTLKDNSRARAQYSFRERIDGTIVDAYLNFKNSKLSSIAHEWFHSLDQALSYYETGKGKRSATNAIAGEFAGRKETLDAIKGILKAINKSGHKERLKKELWFDKAFLRYSLRKDEMTARAFEEYIRMKFAEAGIEVEGLSENATNHPTSDEMAVIAPAFDNLFKVLQEKEGKTPGTSVLYHIGEIMEEESDARQLATEAVLTALDDNDIDVVRATDEQTQQMLDVAAEVAEMQKGTAPETASVQEEHHPTVVSSADGAKVLKDLDSAIQEVNAPELLQTPNGTVYGWTDGKKIYLTEAGINPNTPIHEYTHLWAKAMMQKNPKGWNSIKKLLKGTPVWNEVMSDPNYSSIHNDEDAVASEALSRISGKENAAKMEQMAQKMIDEAKGTARKLEARGLVQNMRDALNRFWEFVWKDLFKMGRFISVEHVTDRILFDLLNGTDLGELQSGRKEFSFIGEKGAESIDNADETTVRLDNLATAREMEESGKDAKSIKLATGWERGADGKWRYEISDKDFRLKETWREARTLGDAIEHDELFAAYPHLKDLRLSYKVIPKYANEPVYAVLRPEGIWINPYPSKSKDYDLRAVLIHEIQHAIQNEEGFAKGGNPNMQDPRQAKAREGNIAYFTQKIADDKAAAEELQKQKDELNEKISSWRARHDGNASFDEEYREYTAKLSDVSGKLDELNQSINHDKMLLTLSETSSTTLGDAGYRRLAGEVEARNAAARIPMSLSERLSTIAEETEDVAREDQYVLENLSEGQVQAQIVTDPDVIAELEASPKRTGYRNVVQNEDGTFSSPMAYWLQGTKEGAKSRVETAKFELGKWEEAEEHPELVDEKGHVVLVKPNKSTVEVAYDPYIHNRLDPVNLQFKDAWKRDELVYVETVVPETDLESGYHADQALLPVGVHSWSNGDVMLSKYDKPVRIMPWDAVADAWVERLNGNGVHFDVVPPALRSLLIERGVEILPPHKGMGKDCNDAYEAWKKENEIALSRKGKINANFVEQFEFKQNNERQELEYSDEFRRLQEESSRMSGQLVSEKDGVQQAAIRGLVGRIGGTLQRELDRATSGRGNKLRTVVNESKGTSFDIIENVDGRLFHDIFEIVRAYLPNGELVDLHDNYDDAICYITSDGLAGFAVSSDGNLISVYSLYGKSKKGFLGAIKDLITEAGATHLDGYNSRLQPLAEIYSKVFGWKVASMMDYNMEYDHDNIAENHGMPQVAFMVNTDADIETRHFDKDQYDDAVAYQLEQVAKSKENSLSSQSYEGTGEYNTASDGRGEGVQEELPVLRPALLLGAGSVDGEVSQADFSRFNPISKRDGESDRQRNNRENKFLSFFNRLTSEEQTNLYIFLKDYSSSPSGILRGRATDFINSIRQKGNNDFADFVEDFINDELKYREGVSSAAVARHGLLVGVDQNLNALERMFYAFNKDQYNGVLFDRVLKLAKRFGVTVKFATRNADGSFISEYGSYNPNDNSITLDANLLVKGSESELCQTIVHELIHSVVARAASIMTGRAVDKNNQFIDPQSLPKDVVDGINTLKEVYEAIKDDGTFQDTYGKKDFEEMLSEITDPKFRGLLKAKKLWKKFLNGICKLLGIADESSSESDALTEIESAIDNILSAAERGELDSAYASYLGQLADGYTLADLQRLGSGPVKTLLTQNVLFRTGIDVDTMATETAKEVYGRAVKARWQEFQRQFQDAMQPVRIAIDAIQQETGNIPIEDYENYLLIKNQASSRSRVEIDNFGRRHFDPILKQVNKIIDQIMKSRGWKVNDESKRADVYAEVKQYLIAKHGLERNELYQTTKTRNLNIGERTREINNAQKIYDDKVNQINLDASLTDAERQLQLREALDAYNATLEEIRTRQVPDVRDYSGLTALFGLEAKEYVEAERLAQELVDNFENEVSTDELWAKINAATNKTLRHSYECGLISRSQYEQIRDMFKFYIPLRGFDETTAEDVYSYLRFESNSFSPAVKEAKGRTSIADDPLAYIMTMAESEITQGNNNRAKQALYNFILNRASATGKQNTLMQVEDVWYVKSVDANGKASQQIAAPNHAAGETYEEFEVRMTALEAAGNAFKSKKGQVDVGMRFQVKRNQDAHYVYLKVNGVEKAIYINGDPKAADAINGRYAEKPGRIEEKMREANRLISSTFTNYSLEFTLRNFTRDMIYANINLAIKEPDPAYRRKFRRNWAHNNMGAMIKMLQAYRAGEFEGRTDLNEDEAAFVEFMENGGQTGYTLINSVESRKKDLERAIKRMQNGIDKGGVKDSTVFRYTLGGIELLNEASELVTRFAAFKTSRDMGRSILRSVSDAKEITVNFNTKGAQDGKGWMGMLAKWFGATRFFFNASVQGIQNVKAMANANKFKFGGVVAGLVASGFLMPILQGMLIELLGGDDDWYWDIPEYDRQSGICIVIGEGKYVKISLPVGLNKMYAIGDTVASWVFDKKHHHTIADVGMEVANLVASTILPVNPLEGTVNELSLMQSVVNAVAPSSTQAVIQNLTNTDWKGAPIQKEYTYNRNDPQWEKAYSSNPAVLKALSKWCYENVKLDGWFRGWDWSPEYLDNTLSNLGGGIYSLIKKTGNAISMIWNEDARELSKVPLVGVFFGTTGDRFGYVNEAYYDLDEEFNSEVNPIKKTAKAFGYSLDEVFKPVGEGGKRAGDHHPKMQKDVYGNRHFEHMQAWYLGQKKLDSINDEIEKQEKKMAKMENPPQGEIDKMTKLQAEYETTRTELVNGMLESKYEQIIDKFRK